jgi:hypothetical protein
VQLVARQTIGDARNTNMAAVAAKPFQLRRIPCTLLWNFWPRNLLRERPRATVSLVQ